MIDSRANVEVPHTANPDHPETHGSLDELTQADHLAQHRKQRDSKRSLFVAGIVMAAAIALHNIPEGMTIDACCAVQQGETLGSDFILAVLIGLHNIPEGMAISVPLINGDEKVPCSFDYCRERTPDCYRRIVWVLAWRYWSAGA